MKCLEVHEVKSAVVTGSNRGIGLAILRYLVANCGSEAQIFACSRSVSAEQAELAAAANVHLITLDVTKKEEVGAAVAKVTEVLGGKGLNLLINNAGMLGGSVHTKPQDCSPEELNKVYNVNTACLHHVTTSFYPLLRLAASSSPDMPLCAARAAVINFSSILASIELAPPFGTSLMAFSYALSKCAVNILTKLCAAEWKSEGIMVIAWHPGWVKTHMGAAASGGEEGVAGEYTADESVGHLMEVVSKMSEEHTGKYLGKDFWNIPY